MNRKQTIFILLATSLTVIGCGRSNYFLRLDNPPGLEGYLGFKWTTPKDFIEKRFLEYSYGSVPMPELTTGSILSYSNVSFLSKRASLCQLFCGDTGYYHAKLVFKTTDASSAEDVRFLRERLSEIYGRPHGTASEVDPYTVENILANYTWAHCSLELSLEPDTTIVINAYENNSCPQEQYHEDGAITN
jgi:hypothetical protein